MNQDILEQLQKLYTEIPEDVLDFNARTDKMNDIRENIENYKTKINDLEDKTSNLENYKITGINANNSILRELSYQQLIDDNNTKITSLENTVASLKNLITFEEGSKKSLVTIPPRLREGIEGKIDGRISDYKSQLKEAKEKLKEVKSNNSQLNNELKDIRVDINEYDNESLEKDKNDIERYKVLLANYNDMENDLFINPRLVISDLMNRYQNGNANDNDIIEALTSLKSKVSNEEYGKEELGRIDEIDSIMQTEAICQKQIDELSDKLANKDNYKKEKDNSKNIVLSNRIANYLKEEQNNLAGELVNVNRREEVNNEYAEQIAALTAIVDQEIDELQTKILLSDYSDEELSQIRKELENKRNEREKIRKDYSIDELEQLITSEQDSLSLKKQELNAKNSVIESRFYRCGTVIRSNLNKNEKYDKAQIRIDEQRLSELKTDLKMLQNRKEYLSYSISDSIEKIISEIKEKELVPAVEETKEDIVVPIIATNNETESVISEPVQNEEENIVVPVLDASNQKDSYSEKLEGKRFYRDENYYKGYNIKAYNKVIGRHNAPEELEEELKNPTLFTKIREWAEKHKKALAVIGGVVAVTAIIAGLNSCQDINLDNDLDNLVDKPTLEPLPEAQDLGITNDIVADVEPVAEPVVSTIPTTVTNNTPVVEQPQNIEPLPANLPISFDDPNQPQQPLPEVTDTTEHHHHHHGGGNDTPVVPEEPINPNVVADLAPGESLEFADDNGHTRTISNNGDGIASSDSTIPEDISIVSDNDNVRVELPVDYTDNVSTDIPVEPIEETVEDRVEDISQEIDLSQYTPEQIEQILDNQENGVENPTEDIEKPQDVTNTVEELREMRNSIVENATMTPSDQVTVSNDPVVSSNDTVTVSSEEATNEGPVR